MIKFYFPRWFFPNNLGDSVITTFIPKLLNLHYKDSIEVITYGSNLIDCLKNNPYVYNVREPYVEEIKDIEYWRTPTLSDKSFSVYPEWHPKAFSLWSSNFDLFCNHPSLNIITLSYLLQLGLEEYAFNNYNLLPYIPINNKIPKLSKKINIAIVPEDKKGGRPVSHPGCDGIGYKLNGSTGLQDWKRIISLVKNNIDCTIYEFSPKFLNIGDIHIPHIKSYIDLATFCKGFDCAILSDGGLHHIFNSQKVPVYLLGTQKINKPYFFKLANGYFDEELYTNCISKCFKTIKNISGWPDLTKCCDYSCESISPEKITESFFKFLKNISI